MRKPPNNHIRDLWNNSGPFIGELGAPHGRVTVEVGWTLHLSTEANFGSYHRGPIRWFQRADNSQVETEIPNIKTIEIDRSIDTDAATCKITMFNQKMLALGVTADSGTAGEMVEQPGYYTFSRGESDMGLTLWGHVVNEWQDVLVPNALLRTYQGYGGRSKTIDQAQTDGNIIQTGLWLIDDVQINAQTGMLNINCRDMMKLAIDQEIYPPLVPIHGTQVHYPLYYHRWTDIHKEAIPYGTTIYNVGWTAIEGALTYSASTSAVEGSSIDGHEPADSIDGEDSESYWLSGGHVTGSTGADLEFIEYNTTGHPSFNGMNLYPFDGNYHVYISVRIGGVWQGGHTIPYTGTQFSGFYEPSIPYVHKITIGWNNDRIFYLPATYANVEKVRLTFTNLAKTSVGPKFYRCGIRSIEIGNSTHQVSGNGKKIVGITRASDTEDLGYYMAGNDGGIFGYGPNIKFFGSEGSHRLNKGIVGVESDKRGSGYRMVGADGGIFGYGDDPYKGSLPGLGIAVADVVDVANGDSSVSQYRGYYILRSGGQVYAFGTANYHGNFTLGGSAVAIAQRHQGGYWICNSAGRVQGFGGAAHHGDLTGVTLNAPIVDMDATFSGNGYWMVGADGGIFGYGDADYFGSAASLTLNDPISGITGMHDDAGYWLCGEDGGVFGYGSALFWGSLPQQYDFSGPGNYTDYVDIVKDLLLWSGWWFYKPALGQASPAVVFGNLESTGIYSPENLTEDFFDKKPVIDVINTLKEIVGYIVYVDEIGAFHFESPNIWSIGNFLETGQPTLYTFQVDEKKQIIDYTADVDYHDARTSITISSADPLAKYPDTVTTKVNSQWGADALRGIVRPALWVNGAFIDKTVQKTMAELIDLHLFMASRQGQVTIPANPIFQVNDQIRIFERTTADTYVHYLRGYTSSMDLESGKYEMTVQTHWMGDGTAWFLTYE